MQTKTEIDQFQDYLDDASNMGGGCADKLFLPENEDELSAIFADAYSNGEPITISGARTGTVGGAIPRGGWIVSLEKLNSLVIDEEAKTATAGAGVLLTEIQKETARHGLFYPPDPTEWSCQIGGNVATNASGARSFKYGATRDFVNALRVVLPSGERLNLRRGESRADNGILELVTDGGNTIKTKVPGYKRPGVRKDASGFFVGEEVDAVDLFVGSEGLLGAVTEVELRLLSKPESFLSGIVFFDEDNDLLDFAAEIKRLSFHNRGLSGSSHAIDATLIEYFDKNSLDFIRSKFPETPDGKAGAIFFEQETDKANEDAVFGMWNEVLEKYNADIDASWFAVEAGDMEKMRSFRHALPVSVNEKVVKNGQRKIGTDMAVPDERFLQFLEYYRRLLDGSGMEYVIFGHIGDNHLHANLIPKNEEEARKAKLIYGRLIARALMYGGTVSAEHGIGKLKSKYLYVMYGERYINEMAELKKAVDVKNLLNRGNMFDEKFLVV